MRKEKREVGKGESWRSGTNFKKYRDNFDKIFQKKNKKLKRKNN